MNLVDAIGLADLDERRTGVALAWDGGSSTYTELTRDISRSSAVLRAHGAKVNSRVGILLPTGTNWLLSYYASLKLGALAVPLNTKLQSEELDLILRDANVQVLVTNCELHGKVERACRVARTILLQTGESLADVPDLDRRSGDTRTANVSKDSPAVILYTSGTTAAPKGVVLSHGNLAFCARSKTHYTRMTRADKVLLCLPLHHCYGQNGILNPCCQAGAQLIMLPAFGPKTVCSAAREYHATMFFGVPAMYRALIHSGASSCDLASIRYYFSAGAPMPIELAQAWREAYGSVIYEGYGLTETSPFAAYNHDREYRPGSIGMPVEGVQMEVVTDSGDYAPPGKVGEIHIRGPNVMLGYWNDRAATDAAIHDRWLRTGDLGYRDQDAYYYLVGRSKELIIVAGQNVYPDEVERVLVRHPQVREICVVGRPDPRRGESVSAVVVPADALAPPKLRDLQRFAARRLAAYKLPTRMQIVATLPKTSTGKVQRWMLKTEGRDTGGVEPLKGSGA